MDNNLQKQFQTPNMFFKVNLMGKQEIINISDEAFAYLSSIGIDWCNQSEVESLDINKYIIALFAMNKTSEAWIEIRDALDKIAAGEENSFDINNVIMSEFFKPCEDNDLFIEYLGSAHKSGMIDDSLYLRHQLVSNVYDDEFIIKTLGLDSETPINANIIFETLYNKVSDISSDNDVYRFPPVVKNYLLTTALYNKEEPVDKFFNMASTKTLFIPDAQLILKFMDEDVIHIIFNFAYHILFSSCSSYEEIENMVNVIVEYIENGTYIDPSEYLEKVKNGEMTIQEMSDATWENEKSFKNINYFNDDIGISFINSMIAHNVSDEKLLEFIFNNGILLSKTYLVADILMKSRNIDINDYDYMKYLTVENINYIYFYRNNEILKSPSEYYFEAYTCDGCTKPIIVHRLTNVMFFEGLTIQLSDINESSELFGWIYKSEIDVNSVPLNLASELDYENLRFTILKIMDKYNERMTEDVSEDPILGNIPPIPKDDGVVEYNDTLVTANDGCIEVYNPVYKAYEILTNALEHGPDSPCCDSEIEEAIGYLSKALGEDSDTVADLDI